MSLCKTHDEPAVSETLPVSLVDASWRNYIIGVGVPMALFCLAFSIGAWFHSGWTTSLLTSLILWPFGLAFVFGTARVLNHNLRTRIPTVELWNDELVVLYGERKLAAKIKDCHVRRGRAVWMRLVGGVKLYCWCPVILIDLPSYWSSRIGIRLPPRNTVAVGYSTEMQHKSERALLQYTAKEVVNPSGGSGRS